MLADVKRRRASGIAVLTAAMVAAACARRTPVVAVGALGGGLDAFLAAHRLGAEQAIRVDEVARTGAASYHLVQAHGSERPHRHVTHDLTVVVLRGRGTLVLDATRLTLAAGDAVLIPRGVRHWFANGGGRSVAVALVAFTPPLDAPDNQPAD